MKNDDLVERNDVVMKNDDVAEINDVIIKNDDVADRNDAVMKNDDAAEKIDVIMKSDDVAERNDDMAMKNTQPDPFVRIRCYIYLVKRKRESYAGVFASRPIKIGEPLTDDYRFVHFGPMLVCKCGASNCQGLLGSKKIVNQVPLSLKEVANEYTARIDKRGIYPN